MNNAQDRLPGNGHLERDAPPHVADADVFQPAQVGHVGPVGQVRPDEIKRHPCFSPDDHIRPRRRTPKEIGRRGRLRPSCRIEMVLRPIPVQVDGFNFS